MAEELNGKKRDPREEELDRFWDIDALIPAKKPVPPAVNTDTVEVVLEPKTGTASATGEIPLPPRREPERHFIPPHTAEEERRAPQPDEEYAPQHALLHQVRIYRWKSNYHYYEDFLRDAARLYPIRGEECQRVPFFSYVPQYSQMSRSQLEWYLWWRESLRQGRYPETDYSYVLLYAYEQINLCGKIPPAVAQQALCGLWAHYRRTYRQLDSYLPEWICDLSLIHRLPPPAWSDPDLAKAAMEHCRLREFFVTCAKEEGYAHALLAFCSNYDHHKSKFYTKEHAPLFDRAVLQTLQRVTDQTGEEGRLFSKAGLDDSRMLRDAYTGALCAYRCKRKLEVSYCSFSRSHELRYLVTDLVKYTENRVREALGIRSRLTVYALPEKIRAMADRALAEILPAARTVADKKREAAAVYEKLYDQPHRPLSLTAAAEIERCSWQTTQRLVEAFEEDAVAEVTPPVAEITAPTLPTPVVEDGEGEDAEGEIPAPYLPFLRAALREDVGEQKRIAAHIGKSLDVVADEINALAADLLGDILLEDTGAAYAVLEDYRDEAEELLRRKGCI
ncbi:MAG: TerB N-terminal domain-containing protein [Clostridia bacterium]|nr:TerB N-terminal domain-containing protein [Clostridia bacterium]